MTAKEGIAKITKLLGTKAYWREYKWRTSADERIEATERAKRLKAEYEVAKAARKARYDELLADAEYQHLDKRASELHRAMETAFSESHRYRLHVGTNEGIGFFVKASGDNWTDVIRKLEGK